MTTPPEAEALRWPDGTTCPHCGVIGHSYAIKNTPMERSHIALHKWVQGFAMMCASKKGVSAHQLHRTLDITYRSAWFMAHRIRECMRTGGLGPLGGNGQDR